MKKVIDSDPSIKLIFLCSPGNPTGTLVSLDSIRALLEYEAFKGIVVIDEAYQNMPICALCRRSAKASVWPLSGAAYVFSALI
jgi:histidinol-phosphate/aromatic aminotransferase/cobyric acid decarboxylase-like protein